MTDEERADNRKVALLVPALPILVIAAIGAIVAVVLIAIGLPVVGLVCFAASIVLGGALTALILNLSPSPVTANDVLKWLLGSAADRDWSDLGLALVPMVPGAALCAYAARGLRMLTLGEETAAMSGLPMARMRAAALGGAALDAGAGASLVGATPPAGAPPGAPPGAKASTSALTPTAGAQAVPPASRSTGAPTCSTTIITSSSTASRTARAAVTPR